MFRKTYMDIVRAAALLAVGLLPGRAYGQLCDTGASFICDECEYNFVSGSCYWCTSYTFGFGVCDQHGTYCGGTQGGLVPSAGCV